MMTKTLNREEAIEALKAGEKIVPADQDAPGYLHWGGNPFGAVTSARGLIIEEHRFMEIREWRIYEPEPDLMSLLDAYEVAKPGQGLKRNCLVRVSNYVRSNPDPELSATWKTGEQLSWLDIKATDWYITDLPEGAE